MRAVALAVEEGSRRFYITCTISLWIGDGLSSLAIGVKRRQVVRSYASLVKTGDFLRAFVTGLAVYGNGDPASISAEFPSAF